jgi:hypothetical protein
LKKRTKKLLFLCALFDGWGIWTRLVRFGCLILVVALTGAQAAPNAPVINPPPTQKDWAALATLPDWSGVWGPESWLMTTARNPPPWKPEILKDVSALKALEKSGHPKGLDQNCLPEGMPSFMIMTPATTGFPFTRPGHHPERGRRQSPAPHLCRWARSSR